MARPTALFPSRWITRTAAVLAVASAGYLMWAAELTRPQPNDRYVTQVVNELMQRDHLLQIPLDDTIAKRGILLFVKGLDPLKVYFTKQDVAEFTAQAGSVDDQLKKGDIRFGYTMFQRYLQRVTERVRLVHEILAQPLDFNKKERLEFPEQYEFTDGQELRDRWRKRLKFQLLSLKTEDIDMPIETAAAVEKLNKRYDRFQHRMEQTDSDELLEMYLTSFTTSYDPHTTYMSPSSLESFRIQMRLNLEGIGAALKSDEEGYTVVTKVLAGGAADKQGQLQVDDKIVSVGTAQGPMTDIYDMKLTEVVKLIRGPAGTIVRLGVLPGAGGDKKILTITRSRVELSDQEAKGKAFEFGKKSTGAAFKIGVIDLPSFYMDMKAARLGLNANYKSTTRDVGRILDKFKQQAVDIVVLDLRRNGGGSLTEAIDLTGLFIDQGAVVQVKDGVGRLQPYFDDDAGMAWRGPLIVLTSRFSASASEILAGAIQDYKRGLVVGDQSTHGKGTVQSLMELGAELFPRIDNPPNLGALKVTVQKFYRPSGNSTQKRGVTSDVVLPALSGALEGIGESDLEHCIEWDQVAAARMADYRMVNPALVQRLAAASSGRVGQSSDFLDVQKTIGRYKTQKAEKSVSVNEAEFLARQKELDAEAEEEKLFEEDRDRDVIRKDYYLDEVFRIAIDYVNTLRQGQVAAAR